MPECLLGLRAWGGPGCAQAKLGSLVYSSIADRKLAASEVAVASARARIVGGAQLLEPKEGPRDRTGRPKL